MPFLTERSASTAATQLFTAVLTGRHVFIRVRITPTSQGVSASKDMCACVVYFTYFAGACTHIKHRCLVLTPFPYVSMSWLNMLQHWTLPIHKALCRKAPTAALNYIKYHRQKTHTFSSHWLQP